eukprot:PhF_6_TR25167/c0_g1_i2/m.34690
MDSSCYDACRELLVTSKGIPDDYNSDASVLMRHIVAEMKKNTTHQTADHANFYYDMPWSYAGPADQNYSLTRGSTITQDTEFESLRSSVCTTPSEGDNEDMTTNTETTPQVGPSRADTDMDSGNVFQEEVQDVEPYHFSGVYVRFSTARISVTCVKFAHDEDRVIALGTGVGLVMFCTSIDDHLSLGPHFHKLEGHRATVTDIVWSRSNQYLLSCALDKGIRIWDVVRRACVRTLVDESPCLSLHLVPSNNNLVIVSFVKPNLKVFNMSTGKCLRKASAKSSVGCLTWGSSEGSYLFAGDSGGSVIMYDHHPITSDINKLCSITISKGKPVTSLVFQQAYVETAPNVRNHVSTLLASTRNNSIILLHAVVQGEASYFAILRKIDHPHVVSNLRATASTYKSRGVCAISGAEDGCVYIYNMTRLKVQCVAKVEDPKCNHTVLCVDMNRSEDMMACGNARGELILWQRIRFDEFQQLPHTAIQSDATTTMS